MSFGVRDSFSYFYVGSEDDGKTFVGFIDANIVVIGRGDDIAAVVDEDAIGSVVGLEGDITAAVGPEDNASAFVKGPDDISRVVGPADDVTAVVGLEYVLCTLEKLKC